MASTDAKGLRIDLSLLRSLVATAAVLGGLLAVAALADADRDPSDPGPHVLVVPHTPEGEAALARTDARVIARYPEFTLVEASGVDDAKLRGAGGQRRDDIHRVRLPGGSVDPAERRSIAGKGAHHRASELVLIQFVGPVKDEWLAALEDTGATLVHYVPQNGYLVYARGKEVSRIAALVGTVSAVRAATLVLPADKMAAASGTVAVQTVDGAPGTDARGRMTRAARELRPESEAGGLRTQYGQVGAAMLDALASDPGVVGITPYVEPRLEDERGAQIVAGNLTGSAPAGPGYLSWLNGEGFPSGLFDFAIDITDGGLDNGTAGSPGHRDFRVDGAAAGASRVSYADNFTFDSDAEDCGGHGTNVASIAAGFGTAGANRQDGSGFLHGMGVAPRARIGASKVFACDGKFDPAGSLTSLTSSAYGKGARISNNSWGSSDFGSYSAQSAEYDKLVRDAQPAVSGNQQMVEVFSAGNDGDENDGNGNEGYASVGSPGTAKNVITVGASENVRAIGGTDGCGVDDADADDAEDILNLSSRGPTDDGRMKPDLVAPGTHVVGASPQIGTYTGIGVCDNQFPTGNTLYSLVSGTSQAAPHVSGAAALARDWYRRTVGGGTTPPSPALTKAILTTTATEVAGGNSGLGATTARRPNGDEGWGRVNVGTVLDGTQRAYYDQRPADILGASGSAVTRTFDVPDSGAPVDVTLAWTDAPGLPGTNAWMNDLDLVVTAGGRRYLGNVLVNGLSATGGAADFRNNLESVRLPAGTTGPIAVQVVGATIGSDGVPGNADGTDQDFALVVSNAGETAAPVLSEGSTTVDDAPGPGSDHDNVFESGEQADVRTTVRNSGTAAATGVAGTLIGGPGLTVNAPATSSYPDIATGATATNSTDFATQLADTAPCGADALATLTMNTTGPAGTQTIPVALPTGEVGAALATNASGTQVNLPIPDDDPNGVTSSIVVPDRGRIKDLDVRLTELRHPWVGDLIVDLTGPDGTTVRLVQHPGGPDNQTDNPATQTVENAALVGTVFDDEAATNISAGTEPYTGSFRPQNDQLSRFDGKSRRGTWVLRVRDLFEGDTGTLKSWGLTTRKAVCDFDQTAPSLTLPTFPGSPVNVTDATFGFSSPDPDAGFECKLDAGLYDACTSLKKYTGLGEGEHTFSVQAVDGSGNESAERTHTWTVDLTPPQTTIATGPSDFVQATSAGFDLSSSEDGTFECELDGHGYKACTSPFAYPEAGDPPLAEGTHTLRVKATDLAGNVDPTPAAKTWTVDTTPPVPGVTTPSSTTQDRTPVLTGTGARGNGDTSTVTVEIFAGTSASGTPVQVRTVTIDAAGRWTLQAGPLPLGQYTVRARQVDQAGNAGTAIRTFTLVPDAIAPTVTLARPASGSRTADTTPTLSGVAGRDDGDEGTVTVKLFRGTLAAGLPDQTLVVPADPASSAFSVDAAALSEGPWTASAEQLDSAGNVGTSAPSTFSVAEAPNLVVAPADEDLRTLRAGRLTALVACADACSAEAELNVSAAGARRLGLKRRAPAARTVLLGSGAAQVAPGASAAMRVRLTHTARGALRAVRSTTLRLRVKVTTATGGGAMTVNRPLNLRRSGRLARAVRRGLPVYTACSEQCRIGASVSVTRREARRLRLAAGASERVQIAGASTTSGSSATRAVLRVRRSARRALLRARRVSGRLGVIATGTTSAARALGAGLALRR